VLTAAQPAKSATPLRVLLVGAKEEDFFLIRDILERGNSGFAAELDHVHTLGEAREVLQQKSYGLVLFEHETGNANAIRMVSEFHHAGTSIPFILLNEDADESSVADAIESGTWNCVAKSRLDGATLIRTIRSTIAFHSMQRDQQSAEESLRKLSRAVQQSADTIVITNREGIIEYVNPAFESLTGYTRDEVRGKTPRILKSGEQAADVYQQLWRTIVAGNVYRGILVNRKKNGDRYYVEESISPVRDADGNITHFIANGRDLTERHHLEEELRQSQKMDAIGQLAGGIAHDFNNLLTIITSYSELALDDVDESGQVHAKLQEILLAARRAAELTRQLLAFSRKQPQALRLLDLNEMLAGIAKTLPRLIGEDIQFSFAPGHNLGKVRVDPVQIEQILMNLAANARDAMPQGGTLRVETSDVFLDDRYVHKKGAVIQPGRYALITITDDGAGIPPEHLPHIFEPFYTTKPLGAGTGLGLATVYGIVKQNKGFIWAYSEPAMGTVFKIYLPCVAEQPTQSRETTTTKPEKQVKGSETILLVEDEPAVRYATAEFLRLQGYTVMEAKDGLDALLVSGEYRGRIDLVITDVVMPNLSGGQLATKLRNLRPQTKLIFVSGYAGQTVLDHNVLDLETNFLQKPFTLKQLSSKIRAALESASRSSTPEGLASH